MFKKVVAYFPVRLGGVSGWHDAAQEFLQKFVNLILFTLLPPKKSGWLIDIGIVNPLSLAVLWIRIQCGLWILIRISFEGWRLLLYLRYLVIKTLDPYPDQDSLEMMDPDPYPDSMNPDLQHWFLSTVRTTWFTWCPGRSWRHHRSEQLWWPWSAGAPAQQRPCSHCCPSCSRT